VRVRDGDRLEAAAPLDLLGRGVVEQRHTVPHQQPLAERHEQRTLADRERWLRADAGQLELWRHPVPLPCARLGHGGPSLAARGHVLARVLAD